MTANMQDVTPQESTKSRVLCYSDHMKQIARLVRELRAERNMTRKDLSKKSDISERYLAQVEAGKANISVALLWRLAESMEVSFNSFFPAGNEPEVVSSTLKTLLTSLSAEQQRNAHEILANYFAHQKTPINGVALIGLRGAGKSTLGRQLSEKAGIPYVSLAAIIEKLAGVELQEILSMFGQRAFRRLEREALDYILDNYDQVILEVGGNLVSEKDTFDHLLNSFYTVWVRAKLEDHISRVLKKGDQGPLRDSKLAMEDLKQILSEREPFYMSANWVINTSGRSIEECTDELFTKCKTKYNHWQLKS